MKNVPFSIIENPNHATGLFTNLTTFLAYDRQKKDVYFERTAPAAVNDRFETAVTPKQAIARLKAMGFLKGKANNQVMFEHGPTGEQLSIAVNRHNVVIGSHFLETDDAPVSYLTDTRHLLNELFGETVAA